MIGQSLFSVRSGIHSWNVKRKLKNVNNKKALLIKYPTVFQFENDDYSIEINGQLSINDNCKCDYGRSSIIRMGKGSKIIVNGNFRFYYGADIQLFDRATLVLGNSFINSDCKIRCSKNISIGDNCAISHDVTIMDSDYHQIEGEKNTKPIVIADDVWIGTRCTVLKGVTIGEGAVIAAGSIVTKDVMPHTLVAGNPARVVRINVYWRH